MSGLAAWEIYTPSYYTGPQADHTTGKLGKACVAFHYSGLTGRKEPVLASLNAKLRGARVHFSHHNSPNSRALTDHSGVPFKH